MVTLFRQTLTLILTHTVRLTALTYHCGFQQATKRMLTLHHFLQWGLSITYSIRVVIIFRISSSENVNKHNHTISLLRRYHIYMIVPTKLSF